MLPAIGDKTDTLLRDLLPSFSPIVKGAELQYDSKENTSKIDLPAAPGAEYSFTLWFSENGEREINAKLRRHQNDHPYFWDRPYELAEFRNNLENLEAKFCEELGILLTHETRIIQKKDGYFGAFAVNAGNERYGNAFTVISHCGGASPPTLPARVEFIALLQSLVQVCYLRVLDPFRAHTSAASTALTKN